MAGTSAALSAAAAPLLSRSALLACLLPGLALHTPSLPAGLQHVRTKVYTSNVMDEERTKRITDHMDYMRARKAYRNGLYKLVLGWRHDMRQQALKDQAQLRQERGAAAREEAQDLAQRLREKQLDGLGEQLKQVELEHQVVSGPALAFVLGDRPLPCKPIPLGRDGMGAAAGRQTAHTPLSDPAVRSAGTSPAAAG